MEGIGTLRPTYTLAHPLANIAEMVRIGTLRPTYTLAHPLANIAEMVRIGTLRPTYTLAHQLANIANTQNFLKNQGAPYKNPGFSPDMTNQGMR